MANLNIRIRLLCKGTPYRFVRYFSVRLVFILKNVCTFIKQRFHSENY